MDNSKLVSPAPAIGSRTTNPFASEDNLLILPHGQEVHPLKDSFHLAAWILSGDRLLTEAYLMMQPQSSVHLGPLGLINSTTQPGRIGVGGASKGKWIYFRHLSMK